MVKFIAIDSGTHLTGYAVFQGTTLITADVLIAPKKAWAHERIGVILEQVRAVLAEHSPTLVVCETSYSRWTPEIALMIKTLRRLTTLEGMDWIGYTSNTIIRNMLKSTNGSIPKKREKRKQTIADGVYRLYPEYKSVVQQDTLDAIAVGHTYLRKTGQVS